MVALDKRTNSCDASLGSNLPEMGDSKETRQTEIAKTVTSLVMPVARAMSSQKMLEVFKSLTAAAPDWDSLPKANQWVLLFNEIQTVLDSNNVDLRSGRANHYGQVPTDSSRPSISPRGRPALNRPRKPLATSRLNSRVPSMSRLPSELGSEEPLRRALGPLRLTSESTAERRCVSSCASHALLPLVGKDWLREDAEYREKELRLQCLHKSRDASVTRFSKLVRGDIRSYIGDRSLEKEMQATPSRSPTSTFTRTPQRDRPGLPRSPQRPPLARTNPDHALVAFDRQHRPAVSAPKHVRLTRACILRQEALRNPARYRIIDGRKVRIM